MELVSFSTLTSPLPSSSSSSSTPTSDHSHHHSSSPLLHLLPPTGSSSSSHHHPAVAAGPAALSSMTSTSTAALDVSCELLRAFTIMANYCPSILVSLSYFPQVYTYIHLLALALSLLDMFYLSSCPSLHAMFYLPTYLPTYRPTYLSIIRRCTWR